MSVLSLARKVVYVTVIRYMRYILIATVQSSCRLTPATIYERQVLHEGRVLVPGYPHLQRAQPIWIAHQLLAHAWSFSRDLERLQLSQKHVNQSPLGAAAMAGTPHPIDRALSAKLLGFEGVIENAMDARWHPVGCGEKGTSTV